MTNCNFFDLTVFQWIQKHDVDEYSFFGKLANPHPKDLSPRNIDGNFI